MRNVKRVPRWVGVAVTLAAYMGLFFTAKYKFWADVVWIVFFAVWLLAPYWYDSP